MMTDLYRASILFAAVILNPFFGWAEQTETAPRYQHHGNHHHDFSDTGKWAERFEDPERDVWQLPDKVIEVLSLPADARVADIGSATGYFPIRLARAVKAGRVWGIDIAPEMVRYLNERADDEGIGNLFSVLGTADDPMLPEKVDLVLLVNTYHHIENRSVYFAKLRARLRHGGRLAIIDFKKGDLPFGPSDDAKLPPEQVAAELAEAGFVLSENQKFLQYQYFLIFDQAPAD